MAAVEDALEVGCLHVGLIASRNIKALKQGGIGDFFGLTPQHKPYCKITMGGHEFTSGVGIRTTAGHAWNRERMSFPVKVPLSCVVGISRDQQQWWNARSNTGSRSRSRSGCGAGATGGAQKGCTVVGSGCLKTCGGSSGERGKGSGAAADTGGGGDVACGSSLSRAVAATDTAVAHEVWRRLTLRIQLLHREDASADSKETGQTATAPAGECSEARNSTGSGSSNSNSTSPTTAMEIRDSANKDHGGDPLLGECSLNLVEVVSGRAPHIEEWVPLDSEGDLRLSLDYDSVGTMPAPGDSVVLLCLTNRLDYFPLPVWDASFTADPGRPGSASWLWARDASQRRWLGPGGSGGGGGGVFQVEEAGDDFFLISYATPEGWRCAVEVHRFLVHADPMLPRRWTLSEVRDHAIATPAAAAVRGALLRASREDSIWAGGKELAVGVTQGVCWTAARWWGGGLEIVRNDVCFALGLADAESSAKSEEAEQGNAEEEQERAREADSGWDNAENDSERRDHPRQLKMLPSTTSDADVAGLAGDGAHAAAAGAASPSGMDRKSQAAAPLVAVPSGPSQPQPPRYPQQHLCPITRCPIEDPAVAADGYTYERAAIERWLSDHDTSPVTGKVLETKVVFKNWSLVSSSPTSRAAQGEETPGA
eukprot:g7880.t1